MNLWGMETMNPVAIHIDNYRELIVKYVEKIKKIVDRVWGK
jgi:hypothetical protein